MSEMETSDNDIIFTFYLPGMFLVSFPHALLHGGYWALVFIIVAAVICYHTGMILIDCMYEPVDDSNTDIIATAAPHPNDDPCPPPDAVQQLARVRSSYTDIAVAVWGRRLGKLFVSGAQLIELLMTCILYLVLCGDMMLACFPQGRINLSGYIALSAMVLLPCAFLTSPKTVSWLSFWNTVTHLIINAVFIFYCITLYKQWDVKVVKFSIDIHKFPISVGIIVFSYTSQIFLPTLERNMVDRGQFKPMLRITHIAAAIGKAVFGYIGVITFGKQTEEVITMNIESHIFKLIFNFPLFIKALLSYPLPYYAAVELLEEEFREFIYPKVTQTTLTDPETKYNIDFSKKDKENEAGYFQNGDKDSSYDLQGANKYTCSQEQPQPKSTKLQKIKLAARIDITSKPTKLPIRVLVFRFFLVGVTFVMAVVIPHFAILMGLIGSFTGTMLSLVWPAYFQLKLKKGRLSMRKRVVNYSVIVLGFFCAFVGIYFSGLALHKVMREGKNQESMKKSSLPILTVENGTCFPNTC